MNIYIDESSTSPYHIIVVEIDKNITALKKGLQKIPKTKDLSYIHMRKEKPTNREYYIQETIKLKNKYQFNVKILYTHKNINDLLARKKLLIHYATNISPNVNYIALERNDTTIKNDLKNLHKGFRNTETKNKIQIDFVKPNQLQHALIWLPDIFG